MEDDRIKKMTQMDPTELRAELETMTTDELRSIALSLAQLLESKS